MSINNFINKRIYLYYIRGVAGVVKRDRFRPYWLSAYAGSSPVPRIYYFLIFCVQAKRELLGVNHVYFYANFTYTILYSMNFGVGFFSLFGCFQFKS